MSEVGVMRLEAARQLHRQGRLHEAEVLYREVLKAAPEHPEALHLLGILAMRGGRVVDGVGFLQRAVATSPKQPALLLSLARALLQAGQPHAALATYDRTLALRPDLIEALYERANACMQCQQPQAALEGYERLLERAPTQAAIWVNRGMALQELGRPAEAVESYDRALMLQHDFAEAWNNRGNALRAQLRLEESLADYDRALQLSPQLATAHNNRGLVLRALERHDEALAAFQRAIELAPTFTDALNNRGNVLRDLARPEAALESYERVLALDPGYVEALSNRGNALLDLKHYEAALGCYDQALQRVPNSPDVLANRAAVLFELGQHGATAACLEQLLRVAPLYDYARGHLLTARLYVCEWGEYASQVARIAADLEERRRVAHPFSMMAMSASGRAQLHAAELHAADIKPRAAAFLPSSRGLPHRRLRLAYVSADFREHVVSYLLAGVFERHDRERFETIGISLHPPEEGEMGNRVAAALDRFLDLSARSEREIAVLMRELEVDVAVDLMGYTRKARPGIFAHRAAPVQVNYLGYPGTMGAPFIDYILADEFVIPPQSRQHYAEQVVYLPECFQANDDRRVIGVPPTRAQAGLPGQGLVLCCFNNNYKLSPPLFAVWMRVLQATPGSVLWLLGDRDGTQENLRREARAHGVEAERLVFAGRMGYTEHLGRLGLADLFLDTVPYNAGATASDALRTGVPVLTCVGEAFAARMAGSLLKTVGLPELITCSLEEYEGKALELARQPQALQELRARLARNLTGSPLFDTARFTRHLETAYLTMHQRAVRGEIPRGFSVDPFDRTTLS